MDPKDVIITGLLDALEALTEKAAAVLGDHKIVILDARAAIAGARGQGVRAPLFCYELPMPMTTPVIGPSGSSPEMLLEQQRTLLSTLRGALEALEESWPHGRDYVHGGLDRAVEEYREMGRMLRVLIERTEQRAEYLCDHVR